MRRLLRLICLAPLLYGCAYEEDFNYRFINITDESAAIVADAFQQWSPIIGVSSQESEDARILVRMGNLPANVLGRASTRVVPDTEFGKRLDCAVITFREGMAIELPTALHEIGHVLLLPDLYNVENKSSIMYWRENGVQTIDGNSQEKAREVVGRGWLERITNGPLEGVVWNGRDCHTKDE